MGVIGIVVSSKCQKFEVEISEDRKMKIYYIPYKEHSNKEELKTFLNILRPKKQIFPLHDNFSLKSIERQRYVMAYNVRELYRERFLFENKHYVKPINVRLDDEENIFLCHNNGPIQNKQYQMAMNQNERKRKRVNENDDNEWIPVYDQDSVVSDALSSYGQIKEERIKKRQLDMISIHSFESDRITNFTSLN